MPELPEVENLRIGLEKKVLGQRVKKVTVRHPKLVSGSGNARRASTGKTNEFIRGLTGETISAVERCAKNLIFRFKSGKVLLAHLKMSGQFVHRSLSSRSTHPGSMNSGFRVPPSLKLWRTGKPGMTDGASLPGKHTHIIFELSRGTLYYNDIRAFGYLLYFKNVA
ncbi:MAG: DNA-formamidopyrimidine glycosylase family protein, partial [Candidatus Liptonbacteria bacterium]|nr:DNA-formamidopyrimidine glycosylase family protein [Candidatus Liptonbacteria bacterium]